MDGISETKADVSQQLDAAVESIAVASDSVSEFDENPSWLLEDIRELKHLDRLKLIRALPPPQETSAFRPRSSKKAVACDLDQLPDVLVHSRAEAARGRSTRDLYSAVRKGESTGSLIVKISREESVQRNLEKLNKREQERKRRQHATLRAMASTAGLPRSSSRYIERRRELSRSPARGSAAFRTHETMPRPHTAPNRGRAGSPPREAFLTSKDDGPGREGGAARKRSPSPDKYKNPEEERRQRARIVQTALMGWWYAKNLKINFEMERALMERRGRAALVLQQRLRQLTKARRVMHAADVVPACLRRAIIRYRRRKYISVVKSYLIECAKNQKSKIIRQFLYRVRRLQRLIKSWLATQQARAEVLRRYWDRVEYNYRKGLADDYRAAQEQLIENERKLKKRARAPIAELWSKTNSKVCLLLKKADRVQLRAAREKAFEDNTEMPQHSVSNTQITLGEFEGKIPDDARMKILHDAVKSKRNIFLARRKMEKIAATQALSSKTKINEELVRRMLVNYRAYGSHVVRVQLVTVREVARQQRDRFTRAQNVCFLTNPNLGPSLKSIIEGVVYKDIQLKKEEAAEAERAAKIGRMNRIGSVSAPSSRGGGILKKSKSSVSVGSARGPESDLDDGTASLASGAASPKKAGSPKKSKQVRIIQRLSSLDSADDF